MQPRKRIGIYFTADYVLADLLQQLRQDLGLTWRGLIEHLYKSYRRHETKHTRYEPEPEDTSEC